MKIIVIIRKQAAVYYTTDLPLISALDITYHAPFLCVRLLFYDDLYVSPYGWIARTGPYVVLTYPYKKKCKIILPSVECNF